MLSDEEGGMPPHANASIHALYGSVDDCDAKFLHPVRLNQDKVHCNSNSDHVVVFQDFKISKPDQMSIDIYIYINFTETSHFSSTVRSYSFLRQFLDS